MAQDIARSRAGARHRQRQAAMSLSNWIKLGVKHACGLVLRVSICRRARIGGASGGSGARSFALLVNRDQV